MSEIEFTDEELAQLEGRDMQPDEDAVSAVVGDDEPEPQEDSPDAPEPELAVEEDELEKYKKANAGLLNELVRLRRQSRDDREWRQTVEQRMELLAGKVQPQEDEQQEVVEEEPDRDEDPLAWVAWNQRQQIKKELEPLKAKGEEDEQLKQYNEMLEVAREAAERMENEYIESGSITREDYQTKLDELRYDRLKWYTASGATPRQAMAIVEEEERNFVLGALNQGRNPAEEVVKLHSAIQPRQIPSKDGSPAPKKSPKVSAAKVGAKETGLQNIPGSGGSGTTITAEQFAELEQDDPIFKKIAGSERLFARLNIYGEVTI